MNQTSGFCPVPHFYSFTPQKQSPKPASLPCAEQHIVPEYEMGSLVPLLEFTVEARTSQPG